MLRRNIIIVLLVSLVVALATTASAQMPGPGQVRSTGGGTEVSGPVLTFYKDTTGGSLKMVIIREGLITLALSSMDERVEVFVLRQDSPVGKAGEVLYPSHGDWSALEKLEALIKTIPDQTIRELAENGRQVAMKHVSP